MLQTSSGIHQTWLKPFCRALYTDRDDEDDDRAPTNRGLVQLATSTTRARYQFFIHLAGPETVLDTIVLEDYVLQLFLSLNTFF